MSNRRPRRSRWTVTFSPEDSNNIERKVILATSAAFAKEWYELRGYVVLEVRKGDYRIETRNASLKPSGARPSTLGIRQACVVLGVTLPVEVKVTSRKGGRMGCHTAYPIGPTVKNGKVYGDLTTFPAKFRHVITVKDWLGPQDMGRTIWHELKHAQQFEREALASATSIADALATWKALYCDGTAYAAKRHEREANSAMNNNDMIPCAR